jgi:hypothetical protein
MSWSFLLVGRTAASVRTGICQTIALRESTHWPSRRDKNPKAYPGFDGTAAAGTHEPPSG